ncbi:hypothetical protein B0H65DRAFT_69666 [Neurospora tetraspora]|uniref:GCN5-related N-acetyltransferase Rv2170-like domain-containing protein n=1 Tax=Neurospora tetraspora TaxID=94610 RepID=A0AAE0MXP6_9PEZI|nr:hypothetical protein B0H65DRAFT_69666 [Neurospora tetraspora]
MESSELHLLDTPLPSSSLLALLSQHLPHSLPVLRRLQYAANFPSNGLGTTPYSHVLFASKHSVEECLGLNTATATATQDQHNGFKAEEEHKHFAAAFVDLSRFPETQVWVYSTLEDYAVIDPTGASASSAEVFGSQSHSLPEEEARECDELLLTILRRMRTIAQQMPVELDPSITSHQRQENWREAREYLCMDPSQQNKGSGSGPKIMIGSLAEIHRHRLFLDIDKKHGYNVKMHKTANIPDDIEWEVCQKWLFRTEALVAAGEEALEKTMKEEGLVWDCVRNQKDVRLVQSRTSIKRQEDTLLGLPSVAIRKSTSIGGEGDEILGEMVAWGFMALDGTLMTLHVEEQYRGKGLAKAVACKVMRDHIKDYGNDGLGAADVFVQNFRSQGVCRSIGGRVGWLLSWAVVDLSTVGDAL